MVPYPISTLIPARTTGLAYLNGQRPAGVPSPTELDVHDGAVNIKQGKTKAALRIALERVSWRCCWSACEAARWVDLPDHQRARRAGQRYCHIQALGEGVRGGQHEGLQFRDPRAMAEMDKAESAGDFGEAQRQLGHTTVAMTEHYTRQRRGQKTSPTG